jgi:hypothetical protein
MKRILLILAASAALAHAAEPMHSHPSGTSPYAGQQARDIKALPDAEVQDLLKGAGMGFAKAAELNRYPGPMHTLENADALELTAPQREALTRLMQRHKAEARDLGAELVALERELDGLFASRTATPSQVDAVLHRIGEKTAALRGSHLKTHIEAAAILTPSQIERYTALRGY